MGFAVPWIVVFSGETGTGYGERKRILPAPPYEGDLDYPASIGLEIVPNLVLFFGSNVSKFLLSLCYLFLVENGLDVCF